MFTHQKKAIIVGASSGMGREIAKLLSYEGHIVGLVARRLELLASLEQELLPNKVYMKQIDVTDQSARASLKALIN